MGSVDDIMQLCRLCLVKDQVNIPIFDESSDIRQTFLKINSCLPVKVSRDDNLPKKICDGCSYKLDMLYIFRNTSVDSEKQLLSWLNQAGLGSLPQTSVKEALTKPEIMVKQETFETTDPRIDENPDIGVDAHQEMNIEDQHQELGVDTHSYILQQQKLPYQQEFAFGEPSGSTAGLISEEPVAKRAKRVSSLKKHVPLETEEDDLDNAMQITKAEEEDSDEVDQPDYNEQPSTSADDQPGPSGVGKGTIEAPSVNMDSTRQNKFVCEVCSKICKNRHLLSSHRSRHGERRHKCPHCERKFFRNSDIKEHVRRVHEGHRPWKCDSCNYASSSKTGLRSHTVNVHTKNFPFKCETCNLGFITQSRLKYHQVVHDETRSTCPHCKKLFKDKQHFQLHLAKHNPDYIQTAFTCQLCYKVIFTPKNYHRHMKRHNGSYDNYVCDICGKSLGYLHSLKKHKKIHSGEKNSVCETCGKSFREESFLVEHIRVHTKERPFKCEFCEKSFTQRSSLTIHKRQHTGDRPYKCNICSRGFSSKGALNNHKCKLG